MHATIEAVRLRRLSVLRIIICLAALLSVSGCSTDPESTADKSASKEVATGVEIPESVIVLESAESAEATDARVEIEEAEVTLHALELRQEQLEEREAKDRLEARRAQELQAQVPSPPNPSNAIVASRIFSGRDHYPPADFKAYGILAFPAWPTDATRNRYEIICRAYATVLSHSTVLSAPREVQMVTVWPVESRVLANRLNEQEPGSGDECILAVEFYDALAAKRAIREARAAGASLDGRGPFLLAWAPATTKGDSDALVLRTDLSDVETYSQAYDLMLLWEADIERDPSVWEDGWQLEKLRLAIQRWSGRYGEMILALF